MQQVDCCVSQRVLFKYCVQNSVSWVVFHFLLVFRSQSITITIGLSIFSLNRISQLRQFNEEKKTTQKKKNQDCFVCVKLSDLYWYLKKKKTSIVHDIIYLYPCTTTTLCWNQSTKIIHYQFVSWEIKSSKVCDSIKRRSGGDFVNSSFPQFILYIELNSDEKKRMFFCLAVNK